MWLVPCQLLWVWMVLEWVPAVLAGHYTLSMDSETSCTKTHYYEAGDVFKVLVKGQVHDGHCPLTFIQSGSYRSETADDPCVSVCVKIVSYTMESCEVKMSYHDGLNDFTPVTFDCHTFPPVMWCSSKNDLKVAVSEMKNYHGKDYSVHLEVTPFCGTYQPTTDSGVVSQPKPKSNSMSQVIMIIGSVVGTVSIIFVLGWVMYCWKKRRAPDSESAAHHSSRQERHARDTTPSQGTRYAPVDRNQASSQSSSDRGVATPYKSDLDRGNKPGSGINNFGERRLYSPFQPPAPTNRGPAGQQTFYSDLDRGPGPGDKWYPMTTVSQAQPNLYTPTPSSQATNQYLAQNQVYKYPQYNNADGEMHTAPTDTRYVVYDFDFDQPVERKYSTGKNMRTPMNDSPVKELEGLRKREITPLRETIRVMPPLDSATTDHTSEYESSVSGTTEDETTTDDQMLPVVRPLMSMVPYGMYGQPGLRTNDPNSRLYDPRNFQRVDNNKPIGVSDSLSTRPKDNRLIGISDSSRPKNQSFSDAPSRQTDRPVPGQSVVDGSLGLPRRPSQQDSAAMERADRIPATKEGPMPQVPPIPKDFQRSQIAPSSSSKDLPWPHGPPPPYSPDDKFVV